MSKQLILITAPFNCGYCKRAQDELPTLCESKGWELIEMENEQNDDSLPVNTYPTIMMRVDEKIVDTMTGYAGKGKIEEKLNSY